MKNIVICCDGTNNDVSGDSTNVLRLYRSLKRNREQLAYYDSGVGTLPDPTRITRLAGMVYQSIDSAIGKSVQDNCCQAYQFLARHYEPGDRIFLFGFSRGAYTVRALAGMVHFLGLVRPELDGLAALAWTLFNEKDFAAGNRFRHSFSVSPFDPTRIHFVGVWDTVSAFGWITSLRTVPFSANNPSIDHVRHAVSIDEHRASFRENLFRPKKPDQHQSFKQIWFAGAHCDVGGGYPDPKRKSDKPENGLEKIALEWMYREAGDQGCMLSDNQIAFFLGKKKSGVPQSEPDPTSIAHRSTKRLWHLLEFVPRRQWDHDLNPERMRWFLPNVYRRRKIPEDAVLHPSVKIKLDEDDSYHPKNLPRSYSFGD